MSSLGGFNGGNLNSGNGNRATVGRTLAGVLSGAAANIKSRFSNLNTANSSIQPPSPTTEHTTSTSATPTLNTSTISTHTHGTFRDSSQSPTPHMSSDDKCNNHQQSYSSYQPFHSRFHRQQGNYVNQWSTATGGRFSNNQSVQQLAPTALPTTVPGADRNEAIGGVGGFSASSNSSIPASVQCRSFTSSQATPYAFG